MDAAEDKHSNRDNTHMKKTNRRAMISEYTDTRIDNLHETNENEIG